MTGLTKIVHQIAIAVTQAASRFLPDRVPLTLVGAGCASNLCTAIAQSGARRTLIVTDAVLVKIGLLKGITEALEAGGVAYSVYDGVEPDPTSDHVAAGLAILRRDGCDSILAVGGGSPMDAAKIIAAVATNDKPLRKLEGLLKVWRAPLPLYAIPTTAGTGSEVTIAAVVSDPATHAKKFFIDPKLLPLMAALDPALMVGLPPAVTAATGMDALTHAVESYIATTSKAQTERWATAAIKLIFANLPRACANGADLEARQGMAMASYYAGLAFTRTSVGYVHAIAHTLGAYYRTPHGHANAVVLPHVLEYSIGPSERRLAEMARMVGVQGGSDAALARGFIEAIRELMHTIGIAPTLPALRREDIPSIAGKAVAEAFMNYPVPRPMTPADCEMVVARLLA